MLIVWKYKIEALSSGAEGMEKGVKGNPIWLIAVNEAEVPGYSYWVVPWGATQAGCWNWGLPDEDRLLGGAFGATQTELLSSVKGCAASLWGPWVKNHNWCSWPRVNMGWPFKTSVCENFVSKVMPW